VSCGRDWCYDGPQIKEADTQELNRDLYNPAVAEGAVGSAVGSCAQRDFVQHLVERSAHGVADGDNLNALALQVVAERSDAEKCAGRCSFAHKLEVSQQLDDCKKAAAAAAAVHAAG